MQVVRRRAGRVVPKWSPTGTQGKHRYSVVMRSETHGLVAIVRTDDGMRLNGVSWFDESRHNAIQVAHADLRAFLYADALPYVEFSHEQLIQFATLLNEEVRRNHRTPSFGFQVVHATSCHLLTFLSALATHQLQAMAAIRRMHGEKSTESATAKDAFGRAFDGSRGYRFCYKLRNFAIHCSLGFLSLRITRGRTHPDQSVIPEPSVTLTVSRDYLLSFPTVWGSRVRVELESMPEEIELIRLTEDALVATRHVSRETRLLLHSKIHNNLQLIKEVAAEFATARGQPALVCIEGLAKPTMADWSNIPMSYLDFSMIDAVENALKGQPVRQYHKMFTLE